MKIRNALLSVSDKTGIVELATMLAERQVTIYSTGGTARKLTEAGIAVRPAEELTGNPEAFGGRMKTISFQIESALLYRRGHEQDEIDAKNLGINPLDLVVCNLYPFAEAVRNNADEAGMVEQIDVGGPTMIRAGAKNYESVVCLSDPAQYESFTHEFSNSGETTLELRRDFARQAFEKLSRYDAMIARSMATRLQENHSSVLAPVAKAKELRYGENPQQKSWIIPIDNGVPEAAGLAVSLQGKELSYNNMMDVDAAWKCTSEAHQELKKPTVTVIKHGNPAGLACSSTQQKALEEAWECDPVSAFGSIICLSERVEADQAKFLCDRFVEIVIAPSYSAEAKDLFSKKKNLRLLECPLKTSIGETTYRSVAGHLLVQTEDEGVSPEWRQASKKEWNVSESLSRFSLVANKYLKSNAVVLCSESNGTVMIAGAGMGQPNRLDALKMLAAPRAKERNIDLATCVLVSDAFFPFADSIDVCNEVGIKNVIQPGGSIRDDEVVAACDRYDMAMVMTGRRHFRH